MYGHGVIFYLIIMKERICCIVCAGENKGLDLSILANNFVIAADGGLKYLNDLNIQPNLIVGDFDSINQPEISCEIVKLNEEKDETDTLVCIQEGIKRGYNKFYIFCGTGGRIDHTIANIQSLIYLAQKNCVGFLFDGKQVIVAISSLITLSFSSEASGGISVFAINGNASGVTITGLKYTLNSALLTAEFPLGVSNSFIGKECRIECENGNLAIVFPLDALKHLIIHEK